MDVSFYQVASVEPVLVKLVEKIYDQGKRCVIICQNKEHVIRVDTLLWTQAAFLPHGYRETCEDPTEHPIWVTETWENPNNAEVAVVVNETVSPLVFQQLIDITTGDPKERVAAYQGQVRHLWKQNAQGGWYDSFASS